MWCETDFNHITYFVKLIPVELVSRSGHASHLYQYSVTQYTQLFDTPALFTKATPGIYFKYQLTPIRMTRKLDRTPFLHFYTTLCSIVGGVITVAGILQSLLTHTVAPAKLD